MRHLGLLILVIGIFQSVLSRAQEEETVQFTGENKMVKVEPNYVITTEAEGNYLLVPYRERRSKWGKTFSIGYSTYQPKNYEPNFLAVGFDDLYTAAELPLIDVQFTVKRNTSMGSLGGELGVGIYQNDSDKPKVVDSSLQMIPIRLGAVFSMDAIGPEPYFVPYVSGGLYTVLYKESLNATSKSGNTQVAPYVHGGVAFFLDWIDRQAARVAYEDSGIEASYAFVEARTMFASGDDTDPDIVNPISFAGGFKVEF